MEGEKAVKKRNNAEDKEFAECIIRFIKTEKPTKTSDFVKAGFFRNRNDARTLLRVLTEKGIVRMKRGKNKRYHYGLPSQPLIMPNKTAEKTRVPRR